MGTRYCRVATFSWRLECCLWLWDTPYVQFRGPPSPRPPPLILDYVYGVATYNRWRNRQDGDKAHPVMEKYYIDTYKFALPRTVDYDEFGDTPLRFEEEDDSDFSLGFRKNKTALMALTTLLPHHCNEDLACP